MRIIVCGSRTFDDLLFLARKLETRTRNLKEVVIITGAQVTIDKEGRKYGADYLAEKWALSKGHTVVRYHADWNKHGAKAGPIRNSEMVKESEAKVLIAFWDGKSPGTEDVVAKARKAGLKVIIYKY